MKFLAVNDTQIVAAPAGEEIPNATSYDLTQLTSGFKAIVSQEIKDVLEGLSVARTISELTTELTTKGYSFPGLGETKLFNVVKLLVQYGCVIATVDSPTTEFDPLIKSAPNVMEDIDLAVYDLEVLAGSVSAFQDNHPYPENALDTLSGNSRAFPRPVG